MSNIIKKQGDLHAETVTMADLVATFNFYTVPDKHVKRFASVAVGRVRCANAMLAATDAAAHAGVPKGVKPTPAEAVQAAKAAKAKPKAAPVAKAAPPVKLTSRRSTYTHVRLAAPDVKRRPQAASKRTTVLEALRAADAAAPGEPIEIDALSRKMKFDVRSYMHKLIFQGWAEVVAAPQVEAQ